MSEHAKEPRISGIFGHSEIFQYYEVFLYFGCSFFSQPTQNGEKTNHDIPHNVYISFSFMTRQVNMLFQKKICYFEELSILPNKPFLNSFQFVQ